MATPIQVTFDAHDPAAQAVFWSAALGYIVQPPPDGFDSWEAFATEVGIPESEWDLLAASVDPDGKGPRLLFQRVPESKTVKNRVHLDVNVTDRSMDAEERHMRVDAEVERLIALGATKIEDRGAHGETWTVMHDPEGNEFCVQ